MHTPLFIGRGVSAAWTMAFVAASAAMVFRPAPATAQQVLSGWELYTTDPNSSSFPGLGTMDGVPLGTYNFGGALGITDTDTTDTIIQRTGSATPGNNTINIQMVAMQLETSQQVDFNGNGNAFYFMTLQSAHGGTASTGTETINFTTNTSGTFSASINVFYDIRMGSLTGPIVASSDAMLMSSGTTWGNNPPLFPTVQIAGVNLNLNGNNNTNDFWVSGFNDEGLAAQLASNARWAEYLKAAALPEPSSRRWP